MTTDMIEEVFVVIVTKYDPAEGGTEDVEAKTFTSYPTKEQIAGCMSGWYSEVYHAHVEKRYKVVKP